MEYLNKFTGYLKEIQELYPKVTEKDDATKTTPPTGSVLPMLNLYTGFGFEEMIFSSLVLFLFVAMLVMKYDSYRFLRIARKEIRQEVAKDVSRILEEKFTEEFFEYFLKNLTEQNSQSTQVEDTELDITADSSTIQEETFSSPRATTPKTPRQSRIPVSHFTPMRRSNSDCSPNNINKRSDRGDPGSAIRSPNWERRSRVWIEQNYLMYFGFK